uniref:WEB family protein n=1 Tax=Cannabis sativa TaxID=3483 RepID=A0A803NYL0_CANSA
MGGVCWLLILMAARMRTRKLVLVACINFDPFIKVASPKGRPVIKRRASSENVLHKETELVLAQRELNKIKENLEKVETTKSRAISELERAKKTLYELTTKLNAVKDSKQTANAAAEVVKERAKKLEVEKSKKLIGTEAWKTELDQIRKEYASTVIELDATKQELNMIRQDFDAALEAKLAAFQQAGEAQRLAKVNSEKAVEFSRQIAEMRASAGQFKLAFIQAQEEQSKLIQEREASLQSYIIAKEEAKEKLESLKKEVNIVQNQEARDLEVKLDETNAEIEVLQEEMRKSHAVEMDNVRIVTMELNEATTTLQKASEEESSLKSLVNSLKLELENVKKEMETESLFANYDAEILNKKQKEIELSDELSFKLKNLLEETNRVAQEAEKKLELTLIEAEKVKEAEQKVLDAVKVVNAESNAKIKLSLEKFQSFTKKVQEFQNMADAKEAENEAHVGEIKQRKMEAERKVEANLKAIEEIKIATDMALRKAEMADSAKTVVEGELHKWRQQQEQRNGS